MAHSDGTDSFPAEVQLDMFGPPQVLTPGADAAGLRAELSAILAELRGSAGADARDAAYYRSVLSGMGDVLSSEEAAQLRLELEAELSRLEAA